MAVDFRLLLLVGCPALEGEGEERFDVDGFSVLRRDRSQRVRGKFHDGDVQLRYTIRIFLEKETNDFDVLQVSLETRFLKECSRQSALWTA